MRRGLGERRSEVEANKPLTEVATPSFEAYRKYVDAMRLGGAGDVEGSNRLLREALTLDSGFAAAWASISVNYAMARDPDSSRLALLEALKRPERLNTAMRYKLEAEAAYRLNYDLPATVRWYELHLEHAPQSISGHNNLGVYLSSLGRYEEALAEFQRAVEIDPFGPSQSQIQLFNEAAMLVALGRLDEAAGVGRQLTGPFAEYATLLQATAAGHWSAVESLAAEPVRARGTEVWVKAPAVTMWAGALAARGAVSAADQLLRSSAAEATGPAARGQYHADLVLAVTSGRSMLPVAAVSADTTPGGWTLRGLMAAVHGDTVQAQRSLFRIDSLPKTDRLRLGDGPLLIQAWIAARGGALAGGHPPPRPCGTPGRARRLQPGPGRESWTPLAPCRRLRTCRKARLCSRLLRSRNRADAGAVQPPGFERASVFVRAAPACHSVRSHAPAAVESGALASLHPGFRNSRS